MSLLVVLAMLLLHAVFMAPALPSRAAPLAPLQPVASNGPTYPSWCPAPSASPQSFAPDRSNFCVATSGVLWFINNVPAVTGDVWVSATTQMKSLTVSWQATFYIRSLASSSGPYRLSVAPQCGAHALANARCRLTSSQPTGSSPITAGRYYTVTWQENISLLASKTIVKVSELNPVTFTFDLTAGVLEFEGTFRTRTAGIHCDNIYQGVPGCANNYWKPTLNYDAYDNPKIDAVARHVRTAQIAGKPGAVEFGEPVTRNLAGEETEQRRLSCGSKPYILESIVDECDEYPMASTRNGGAKASVRGVPGASNSSQGGRTSPFYVNHRVLDGDEFYVDATYQDGYGPRNRIMAVGDSITHGFEGDYTWRYRLFLWLTAKEGVDHDWVGPWTGTSYLDEAYPPGWPDVQSPAKHDGPYRPGVYFNSRNLAQWGWSMTEASDAIYQQVLDNNPDVLLVELGFNDIGWGKNTPSGTVTAAKKLIDQARAAKKANTGNTNIKIAIANVVQRTPLSAFPELPGKIDDYNSRLNSAIGDWSIPGSPVRLVDLRGSFVASRDAYDGLHPNSRGEWRIAKKFSEATSEFGMGAVMPDSLVPTEDDPLPIHTPTEFTVTPRADGNLLKWSHVYGATGFWIWTKDLDDPGDAGGRLPLPIGVYQWKAGALKRGHRYSYAVIATRGDAEAAPTRQVEATAVVETAFGPDRYTVTPGATSIALTWDRPSGPYSNTISGYVVYIAYDVDGRQEIKTVETTDPSHTFTGLTPGRKYVFGIASVNHAGEGILAPVAGAVPGYGTPPTPTVTSATTDPRGGDWDQLRMSWTTSPGVADYWIYSRDLNGTAPYDRGVWPVTSPHTGDAFNGSEHWSFCIVATNGTLSSPKPTLSTTPANASFCKTPTVTTGLNASKTAGKTAAEGADKANRSAGSPGTDPRPQYWNFLARVDPRDPTLSRAPLPMRTGPPPIGKQAVKGTVPHAPRP